MINRSSWVLWTILALVGLAADALAADDLITTGDANGLYAGSAKDAERILLVLYEGQNSRRVPSGARVNMYRRHGNYATTTYDRNMATSIARRHGIEYLADWRISELGVHCAVYLIPVGLSVDSTMQRVQADRRVSLVQRMATYRTMAHTYSDPYFELQASAKHFKLAEAHEMATGRDVTVAMIDTGVALDHPDLAGQIAASENFAKGISPGFSYDAHGTAVAGIIAAKRNNGEGIVGVAPESHLIALKACWPTTSGALEARCNSFTLALALNTAMRMGATVLNLSLGGPPDPVIELLIREATRRNIIVVAAIPPGDDPTSGFPASMPEVIAVRSHDPLVQIAGGRPIDGIGRAVAAPGDEILTTVPSGRYDFLSGSSLAAAQVSGYIALMQQMHPDITADEVRRYLRRGASEMNLDQVLISANTTQIAKALE